MHANSLIFAEAGQIQLQARSMTTNIVTICTIPTLPSQITGFRWNSGSSTGTAGKRAERH